MRQKIECPECQSQLAAWIDIDASLEFDVSSSGKLSNRVIEDSDHGEGRYGLKCKACDWWINAWAVEDQNMLKAIADAYEQYRACQLTIVKRKK